MEKNKEKKKVPRKKKRGGGGGDSPPWQFIFSKKNARTASYLAPRPLFLSTNIIRL